MADDDRVDAAAADALTTTTTTTSAHDDAPSSATTSAAVNLSTPGIISVNRPPPTSLGSFLWEIGSGIVQDVATTINNTVSPPTTSPVDESKASTTDSKAAAATASTADAISSAAAETISSAAAVASDAIENIGTHGLALLSSFQSFIGSVVSDQGVNGGDTLWDASDEPNEGQEPEAADRDAEGRRRWVLRTDPPTDTDILTSAIAEKLRSHLPPLLREASSLSLLYSLARDGISLHTVYRNCKVGHDEETGVVTPTPMLVVIRATNGAVFGGFVSERLAVQVGYFGTGACFLWRRDDKDHNEVKVFPATGKNEYFVTCAPDYFALGGGQGRFGLFVADDLLHGHSDPCDTFANVALAGVEDGNGDFRVDCIEVWRFVD